MTQIFRKRRLQELFRHSFEEEKQWKMISASRFLKHQQQHFPALCWRKATTYAFRVLIVAPLIDQTDAFDQHKWRKFAYVTLYSSFRAFLEEDKRRKFAFAVLYSVFWLFLEDKRRKFAFPVLLKCRHSSFQCAFDEKRDLLLRHLQVCGQQLLTALIILQIGFLKSTFY